MKGELIYSGKAKSVYQTDKADEVIIHYNDDATAGNGAKHAIIDNKGVLNNRIATLIFEHLKKAGIATHHLATLNEREQRCKKVAIIPLEVIVRNVIAGSMAVRLGIAEGTPAKTSILEICYKNDALGDPLINDYHAVALGIVSFDELKEIYQTVLAINERLCKLFAQCDLTLVDFKVEFGKTQEGHIILADEISPDTARLWDKHSQEKMDKDRFRHDLGGLTHAYETVLKRLEKVVQG